MKILMRADTHVSIILPSNEYDEPKCTTTQVLAAFAVSMGSMIVGFSSAYTSPALITMHNSLLITEEQQSWIGGLLPLAALMGGCLGGPLIEYIGRRNTITSTALPFFIGWMLIANANGVEMVLAGRAVCGFCVGIGSLAFPVYLGETIQPEVRGVLGLMPTAVGNIGILLCYVAGSYLDWSALAFVGSALSIPFLGCMLAIPETPRWYISRNKIAEAKKSLQWLRGKKTNIDKELRNVARSESEVHEDDSPLSGLLDPSCLKPIAISLGLMLFQQLSGINAVVFYTVTIFKGAGSSIDGNLCTIILGLVNFVSTFLATTVIDRLGRKVLLYISSVFMLVNLYILGSFFYIRDVNKADTGNLGWLPLMCLIVYILGFSLGFGPVPWLMMGEILPAKVRGAAASIATGFNWTCTFIVTKTFHNIIDIAGLHGVFWLFGSICLVGLFFVIFFVPETSGQSLEEIESKMTGKEEVDKKRRTRRMSSVANIKPLPMGC